MDIIETAVSGLIRLDIVPPGGPVLTSGSRGGSSVVLITVCGETTHRTPILHIQVYFAKK